MEKISSFQITGMTIAGFKSYEEPTDLAFGNPTVITGGNGRGKTSIADAIAFAVTGLPFFGERGIDKLHNESQPDVSITLRFVDEAGCAHTLTRTRHKSNMTILYDGHMIRQMDLTDLFGEKDVFLSIFMDLTALLKKALVIAACVLILLVVVIVVVIRKVVRKRRTKRMAERKQDERSFGGK